MLGEMLSLKHLLVVSLSPSTLIFTSISALKIATEFLIALHGLPVEINLNSLLCNLTTVSTYITRNLSTNLLLSFSTAKLEVAVSKNSSLMIRTSNSSGMKALNTSTTTLMDFQPTKLISH
jgi:hypothetical protein